MKVTIATTTYDKNEEKESRAIINALREWHDLGFNIVVSDGGSSKNLLNQMSEIGKIKIRQRKSEKVGTGIRQAIAEAFRESDVVIFSDGDKGGSYGFQAKAKEFLSELEDRDILVVGRTDNSFDSYPPFQRKIEREIDNYFYSKFIKRISGQDVSDVTYGPRIIGKNAEKYFTDTTYETWAAAYEPILTAARAGLKVGEVKADIKFPSERKEVGDFQKAYRICQAFQLVEPIISQMLSRGEIKHLEELLREFISKTNYILD
ncbi:glycosyltransferase [Candidatus Pacearchaeota archaeon]|nr:glycosyltransferase [Candidatus Pacearchaeota archaeon]